MIMQDKKVSLILTSYNNRELLSETLNNIEEQDYSNVQVVIKDGGSSDGSVEVIRRYVADSKYEVKCSFDKDLGLYDALNIGIGMSDGDIIAICNDKFVYSSVLSDIIKTLDDNPDCVGVHGDLVYTNSGSVVRHWHMGPQKSMYTGWMPGHPTLYLKREIYDQYGLYDTSYRIAADYEFMIRFLKDGSNKLAYIPKTMIEMYYGGTSTGSKASYIKSLKEGHRALISNGVRPAFVIDGLRTIKVLMQFVNA